MLVHWYYNCSLVHGNCLNLPDESEEITLSAYFQHNLGSATVPRQSPKELYHVRMCTTVPQDVELS